MWAVFKIHLSFHYTGWFIGIPVLDDYNPQYIGWYNPQKNHQPTGVLNTIGFHIGSIKHRINQMISPLSHYNSLLHYIFWDPGVNLPTTPCFPRACAGGCQLTSMQLAPVRRPRPCRRGPCPRRFWPGSCGAWRTTLWSSNAENHQKSIPSGKIT